MKDNTGFASFVQDLAAAMNRARQQSGAAVKQSQQPALPASAPKALIFAPHPDDETIVGALALRLLRQAEMNVIDVAVTQGSNKARQQGRLAELADCCKYLGFGLMQTRENGLEGVNPRTRESNPDAWAASVSRIGQILGAAQPRVVFMPHARDWNSTHIGTHHLVMDALARMGCGFSCHVVETEFWGAMDNPNLMVESSIEDVGDLVTALSLHVEEVRRNPYHLRLPAWMIDNVRRGGELVGGQGGAAPDFLFATLYRHCIWRGGRLEPASAKGRFLAASENPAQLFSPLQ